VCIVLARVTNWLANARVSPLSLAPAACRTKTQAAHRESHHLGFVYATPVTHSHTHTHKVVPTESALARGSLQAP